MSDSLQVPPKSKNAPYLQVAEFVAEKLKANQQIKSSMLFNAANEAWDGSMAKGTFSVKQVYDAMELGVNKSILAMTQLENLSPDEVVRHLKQMQNNLPTQSKRTGEMDELQQFSTPPPLAYMANWVANVQPGEQYLEPSAGTGGLAVFGARRTNNIVVNEIGDFRKSILLELPFKTYLNENGSQIGNMRNADHMKDIRPDVVVMNPPFSSTSGRIPGKRDTMEGAKHVHQALQILKDGGRLVAIVGKGMSMDRPSFTKWWQDLQKEYTVRANVGVSGQEYRKYGTTFGNQILIIDKTGPTTKPIITGDVELIEDLAPLLEGVRNERTQRKPNTYQPVVPKAPEVTESADLVEQLALPSVGEMGAGRKPDGDRLEGGGTGRLSEQMPVSGGSKKSGGVPGRGARHDDVSIRGDRHDPSGGSDTGTYQRSPDSDTLDTIIIYRGERSGELENELGGQFWTSNREKAENYGRIHAYRINKDELKHAVEGPGGPDEYVFMEDYPYKFGILEEGRISGQYSWKRVPGRDSYVSEFNEKGYRYQIDFDPGKEKKYCLSNKTTGQIIGDFGDLFDAAHNAERDGAVPPDEVYQLSSHIENKTTKVQQDKFTDSLYVPYTPERIHIKGANPHPTPLVQSAPMGAVTPPVPNYIPAIPMETIKGNSNGQGLSDIQIESVIYAGQAHCRMMPDGTRMGFFIGDGTGVGKGREIAGILLDNWKRGRCKAVWLSEKVSLFDDAKRDVEGILWNKDLIFNLNKISVKENITADSGILFATYDTLKSYSRDNSSIRRLDQVINWLGEDFDGVIVFDEAHNMGNALAIKTERGTSLASRKALAGVELQDKLPKARVLYVSATGAEKITNLTYAKRLGLWGEGTPFADSTSFIHEISVGGIAAMEMVAQDLKAQGLYIARSLSYDGVRYERLEHTLTSDQREQYNTMNEAWQVVLQNINSALVSTGVVDDKGRTLNRQAKSSAMAQFWGAHQRFFNQVLTGMSLPSLIKSIEDDLAADRSVIIQLTSTGEAALNRQIGTDKDLDDLDMTPIDIVMQYVDHCFPIAQYHQVKDENGNTKSELVTDSNGNIIQNANAVALRNELMVRIADLKGQIAGNSLDEIIRHFGPDKVAEVTARKRRIVLDPETGRNTIEKRGQSKVKVDVDAFMNGEKRILAFSEAGGTGSSYHPDRTIKNQQQRAHYVLQAGWQAKKAIQGLGRSHRSNQVHTPIYRLVTTDLHGHKRFISTIARRLDQLGALTRGARKTGSQGIFKEKDNLESDHARDALRLFLTDLAHNAVDEITCGEFENQTGLKLIADDGTILAGQIEISQFLNRLLSMNIDQQNKTFEAFDKRLDRIIDRRLANGTLNVGVETLKAESIEIQSKKQVYQDSASRSKTNYIQLKVTQQNPKRIPFDHLPLTVHGFVQKQRSGKIWVIHSPISGVDSKTGDRQVLYKMTSASKGFQEVSARELREKIEAGEWVKINSKQDAKRLWDSDYAKQPEVLEYNEHIISGLLLPIWDRLLGPPRLYRVQTDTGEQFIGRRIPEANINNVLRNLGAEEISIKMSPDEIVQKVLEGNYRIKLANGWGLKRVEVSGERRIEINGPDLSDYKILEKHDIILENIKYTNRYFVPSGEKSNTALNAVLLNRPIVEATPPDNVRQKTVAKSSKSNQPKIKKNEISPEEIKSGIIIEHYNGNSFDKYFVFNYKVPTRKTEKGRLIVGACKLGAFDGVIPQEYSLDPKGIRIISETALSQDQLERIEKIKDFHKKFNEEHALQPDQSTTSTNLDQAPIAAATDVGSKPQNNLKIEPTGSDQKSLNVESSNLKIRPGDKIEIFTGAGQWGKFVVSDKSEPKNHNDGGLMFHAISVDEGDGATPRRFIVPQEVIRPAIDSNLRGEMIEVGDLVIAKSDSEIHNTYGETPQKVKHIRTHPDGSKWARTDRTGNLHFSTDEWELFQKAKDIDTSSALLQTDDEKIQSAETSPTPPEQTTHSASEPTIEPWQMTRDEFVGEGPIVDDRKYNIHRNVVKLAFYEGKPIPENVLNEYPDLKSDHGEIEQNNKVKHTIQIEKLLGVLNEIVAKKQLGVKISLREGSNGTWTYEKSESRGLTLVGLDKNWTRSDAISNAENYLVEKRDQFENFKLKLKEQHQATYNGVTYGFIKGIRHHGTLRIHSGKFVVWRQERSERRYLNTEELTLNQSLKVATEDARKHLPSTAPRKYNVGGRTFETGYDQPHPFNLGDHVRPTTASLLGEKIPPGRVIEIQHNGYIIVDTDKNKKAHHPGFFKSFNIQQNFVTHEPVGLTDESKKILDSIDKDLGKLRRDLKMKGAGDIHGQLYKILQRDDGSFYFQTTINGHRTDIGLNQESGWTLEQARQAAYNQAATTPTVSENPKDTIGPGISVQPQKQEIAKSAEPTKYEKSLAEYQKFIDELTPTQRALAKELIVENPKSPGLQTRSIQKVLADMPVTMDIADRDNKIDASTHGHPPGFFEPVIAEKDFSPETTTKTASKPPAEPWQMTKSEFVDAVRNGFDFKLLGANQSTTANLREFKDFEALDKAALKHHLSKVAIAFAQGQQVPEQVLNEYPNLNEHFPLIKNKNSTYVSLPPGWRNITEPLIEDTTQRTLEEMPIAVDNNRPVVKDKASTASTFEYKVQHIEELSNAGSIAKAQFHKDAIIHLVKLGRALNGKSLYPMKKMGVISSKGGLAVAGDIYGKWQMPDGTRIQAHLTEERNADQGNIALVVNINDGQNIFFDPKMPVKDLSEKIKDLAKIHQRKSNHGEESGAFETDKVASSSDEIKQQPLPIENTVTPAETAGALQPEIKTAQVTPEGKVTKPLSTINKPDADQRENEKISDDPAQTEREKVARTSITADNTGDRPVVKGKIEAYKNPTFEYNVEDINEYSDEGAIAKSQFHKDAISHLTKLGKALDGKSLIPKKKTGVTSEKAGIAVSGDIWGKWEMPNGIKVDVSLSDTALPNTAFTPVTKSHIALIVRINDGQNHFLNPRVSVEDLSSKIKDLASEYQIIHGARGESKGDQKDQDNIEQPAIDKQLSLFENIDNPSKVKPAIESDLSLYEQRKVADEAFEKEIKRQFGPKANRFEYDRSLYDTSTEEAYIKKVAIDKKAHQVAMDKSEQKISPVDNNDDSNRLESVSADIKEKPQSETLAHPIESPQKVIPSSTITHIPEEDALEVTFDDSNREIARDQIQSPTDDFIPEIGDVIRAKANGDTAKNYGDRLLTVRDIKTYSYGAPKFKSMTINGLKDKGINETHIFSKNDWDLVFRDSKNPNEISGLVQIENIDRIQNALTRYQKRAEKLGVDPIQMSVSPETITEKSRSNPNVVAAHKIVTLSGPVPTIGNWKFVSIFTQERGVVLTRSLPGETLPYDPDTLKCEHCNQNRMRNQTFLLKNNKGEYIQVGSSCLQDFTGVDPKKFLLSTEFLNFRELITAPVDIDNDPDFPQGRNKFSGFGLKQFLAATSDCIRENGWVSTKNADQFTPATAELASALLSQPSRQLGPDEKTWSEVEKVINHFESVESPNDYERNCQKIIQIGYVPDKFTGVAASMVKAYQNYQVDKLRKETSNFVGKVKERRDFDVTVAQIIHPKDYAEYPSWLYKFYDKNGNALVWRSSRYIEDIKLLKQIKIKGTIKNHDVFNDERTTYINRCKLISERKAELKPQDRSMDEDERVVDTHVEEIGNPSDATSEKDMTKQAQGPADPTKVPGENKMAGQVDEEAPPPDAPGKVLDPQSLSEPAVVPSEIPETDSKNINNSSKPLAVSINIPADKALDKETTPVPVENLPQKSKQAEERKDAMEISGRTIEIPYGYPNPRPEKFFVSPTEKPTVIGIKKDVQSYQFHAYGYSTFVKNISKRPQKIIRSSDKIHIVEDGDLSTKELEIKKAIIENLDLKVENKSIENSKETTQPTATKDEKAKANTKEPARGQKQAVSDMHQWIADIHNVAEPHQEVLKQAYDDFAANKSRFLVERNKGFVMEDWIKSSISDKKLNSEAVAIAINSLVKLPKVTSVEAYLDTVARKQSPNRNEVDHIKNAKSEKSTFDKFVDRLKNGQLEIERDNTSEEPIKQPKKQIGETAAESDRSETDNELNSSERTISKGKKTTTEKQRGQKQPSLFDSNESENKNPAPEKKASEITTDKTPVIVRRRRANAAVTESQPIVDENVDVDAKQNKASSITSAKNEKNVELSENHRDGPKKTIVGVVDDNGAIKTNTEKINPPIINQKTEHQIIEQSSNNNQNMDNAEQLSDRGVDAPKINQHGKTERGTMNKNDNFLDVMDEDGSFTQNKASSDMHEWIDANLSDNNLKNRLKKQYDSFNTVKEKSAVDSIQNFPIEEWIKSSISEKELNPESVSVALSQSSKKIKTGKIKSLQGYLDKTAQNHSSELENNADEKPFTMDKSGQDLNQKTKKNVNKQKTVSTKSDKNDRQSLSSEPNEEIPMSVYDFVDKKESDHDNDQNHVGAEVPKQTSSNKINKSMKQASTVDREKTSEKISSDLDSTLKGFVTSIHVSQENILKEFNSFHERLVEISAKLSETLGRFNDLNNNFEETINGSHSRSISDGRSFKDRTLSNSHADSGRTISGTTDGSENPKRQSPEPEHDQPAVAANSRDHGKNNQKTVTENLGQNVDRINNHHLDYWDNDTHSLSVVSVPQYGGSQGRGAVAVFFQSVSPSGPDGQRNGGKDTELELSEIVKTVDKKIGDLNCSHFNVRISDYSRTQASGQTLGNYKGMDKQKMLKTVASVLNGDNRDKTIHIEPGRANLRTWLNEKVTTVTNDIKDRFTKMKSVIPSKIMIEPESPQHEVGKSDQNLSLDSIQQNFEHSIQTSRASDIQNLYLLQERLVETNAALVDTLKSVLKMNGMDKTIVQEGSAKTRPVIQSEMHAEALSSQVGKNEGQSLPLGFHEAKVKEVVDVEIPGASKEPKETKAPSALSVEASDSGTNKESDSTARTKGSLVADNNNRTEPKRGSTIEAPAVHNEASPVQKTENTIKFDKTGEPALYKAAEVILGLSKSDKRDLAKEYYIQERDNKYIKKQFDSGKYGLENIHNHRGFVDFYAEKLGLQPSEKRHNEHPVDSHAAPTEQTTIAGNYQTTSTSNDRPISASEYKLRAIDTYHSRMNAYHEYAESEFRVYKPDNADFKIVKRILNDSHIKCKLGTDGQRNVARTVLYGSPNLKERKEKEADGVRGYVDTTITNALERIKFEKRQPDKTSQPQKPKRKGPSI